MTDALLNKGASERPFVSVILPVRNEADFISRSLGAVLNQDYPEDRIEFIVADGMSTDETRQIVARLQEHHPNLRLLDNPGKIVPTGLNAAIAVARGEIIVRVDGHCEVAADYVSRSVEHLLKDGVDGVGGSIQTIGKGHLSSVIAIAMSSRFGVGGSAFRTITGRNMLVDTVAFPAYTREILERAGPFDEELVRNQDDEYNYRLRKMGAKILLAADVHSKYYSRSSMRRLWRQYFQYGFWKVRVMQKHPRQMRLRQFAPPVLVASLLISALAAPFFFLGWLMLLSVSGTYLLANLLASAAAGGEHGWRIAVALPIIFATLHLAYGAGFLVGLLRFWNRWGESSEASRRSATQTTGV